jgi:hypothetical protein
VFSFSIKIYIYLLCFFFYKKKKVKNAKKRYKKSHKLVGFLLSIFSFRWTNRKHSWKNIDKRIYISNAFFFPSKINFQNALQLFEFPEKASIKVLKSCFDIILCAVLYKKYLPYRVLSALIWKDRVFLKQLFQQYTFVRRKKWQQNQHFKRYKNN